jgi:hypothetical protein
MAGSAGAGGAVGEGKRDQAPSGRLHEGGLREAAEEGVGCELKDNLGRVPRLRYGMEVRFGSGSEKLIAEQERNMFRIYVVVFMMSYDAHERGSRTMEQVYWEDLTREFHPAGVAAWVKPSVENVNLLMWSIQEEPDRGDLPRRWDLYWGLLYHLK